MRNKNVLWMDMVSLRAKEAVSNICDTKKGEPDFSHSQIKISMENREDGSRRDTTPASVTRLIMKVLIVLVLHRADIGMGLGRGSVVPLTLPVVRS